jgi:hypothetical protein
LAGWLNLKIQKVIFFFDYPPSYPKYFGEAGAQDIRLLEAMSEPISESNGLISLAI